MPIYWVGESRHSFALYWEFLEVPDTAGPISSAVPAMRRLQPLDPDYMTPLASCLPRDGVADQRRVRPAPAASVKITVDGVAFDAWGVVRIGEPMKRAPVAMVQAQTWVTSPQEGEKLPAGTVAFKGFGTAFEANFVWEISKESGAVVAKGFTMGGGGDGTFGEFTFTAKPSAGTYSAEVSGGDASGGPEGPGAAVDDKSFTVR